MDETEDLIKKASEIEECEDCPLYKKDCPGGWTSDGTGQPIEPPCTSWNDDDEIYDAVFYHTVGKPDMPILTKIIFIADCIEPSRTSRWVDDVRAVVYKDIDAALIIQLDNTIKCVLKKGTLLHTNTINTRNFYVERARCQNVKKN